MSGNSPACSELHSHFRHIPPRSRAGAALKRTWRLYLATVAIMSLA